MSRKRSKHRKLMASTLRAVRQQSNLTVGKIADRIGNGESSYFMKETGKASFTLRDAVRISQLFAQPVEALFPEFYMEAFLEVPNAD